MDQISITIFRKSHACILEVVLVYNLFRHFRKMDLARRTIESLALWHWFSLVYIFSWIGLLSGFGHNFLLLGIQEKWASWSLRKRKPFSVCSRVCFFLRILLISTALTSIYLLIIKKMWLLRSHKAPAAFKDL